MESKLTVRRLSMRVVLKIWIRSFATVSKEKLNFRLQANSNSLKDSETNEVMVGMWVATDGTAL